MSEEIVKEDGHLVVANDRPSVIIRGQKMAAALSSYARALTFENRSRRNIYRLAGLAPKARDRFFSIFVMIVICATFVLPILSGIVYYVFLASPGFTSEVRFVVRSSAPILSRDRYSGDTVEPKAKIVQDTAVLLNYFGSPAIVQDLQRNVDLHKIFGRDDIDSISRLSSAATQDEVLEYWEKRYSAFVNPKSGIVELEVTAFNPIEARDLVNLVLRLSEQQINKLSSGMWSDLLTSAQTDVDSATRELAETRGKLRDTQNETGVFDVDLSAESLVTILTGVEADIAQLKSRRAALSRSLSANAPQLLDMDRRLAALEDQARALGSRAAGSSTDGANNLANYSGLFDELKLELKIAENKLKSAITELEKVKLVSSLQLVYVDNFTEPTLPDRSTYPNVALSLLLWSLLWGGICGGLVAVTFTVRNKLD